MKSQANQTPIVMLAGLMLVGCHSHMNQVWAGSSGSVPVSAQAPEGFKITPHKSQVIAENAYGMRKTVQHVYADSQYYHIVDGFFGSNRYKASKSGIRVDGKTGINVRRNE